MHTLTVNNIILMQNSNVELQSYCNNSLVCHFNPDKIAVWRESAGGYPAALPYERSKFKELDRAVQDQKLKRVQ
jgi:hypothetical protein